MAMHEFEIVDSSQRGRLAGFYRNALRQSCGSLLGIAQGLLADRELMDAEVHFLQGWIDAHDEIAQGGVGGIVHRRVKAVLADGIITEAERAYLVETLQKLIGGSADADMELPLVTDLVFDDVAGIVFNGNAFCLTGGFVWAPRNVCEIEVTKRGGRVRSSVSKKVQYVVVGSLGSPEWKHGSFGLKIDRAVELRREGVPITVVKEDQWAAAL